MNERQLGSFLLAADNGSFSKAAAKSFISAPALLQQITLLERDLGFSLFDRSPSGVTLTEAGASFYQTAREILRLYEEGRASGQALEKKRSQVLRIACADGDASISLLELCSGFEREERRVTCQFVDIPYDQQLDELEKGTIDIVFLPWMERLADAGFCYTELYRDTYCCAVGEGHRLTKRETVRLEDLDGETVYVESMYREEPQMRLFESTVAEKRLDIVFDESVFSTALLMRVALEGGVVPVPTRYAPACTPPLTCVPLDWGEASYGIVAKADCGQAARAFADYAKSYFAES
ncbi:LysR family transcriptional regulator [Adlercreutzia sp. R7]|uniref:LysR family transcriptional regulator n=1 Tax=Adlercreutzia wanghongyangiae TaxID=3111451 RepID=A0ABU6IH76_9ACTN|nr:LysR family transcriptional regulator [Adlercreutzia sp. R7]